MRNLAKREGGHDWDLTAFRRRPKVELGGASRHTIEHLRPIIVKKGPWPPLDVMQLIPHI